MHQRRVERGFEAPPPRPAAAPAGLAFPVMAKHFTKLGFPGQGTHAKDFNKKHGTDNWQSENAVDIGCPEGTQLVAVADGKIGDRIGALKAKDPRLLGLRLYVVTKDNQFYYAHLSKIDVKAGQQVKKGDVVGKSGSANGVPHLHIAAEHGDPVKMFF
jgi:murein DD-endopeptidase MepM/ murein hydrolase activator NlpD